MSTHPTFFFSFLPFFFFSLLLLPLQYTSVIFSRAGLRSEPSFLAGASAQRIGGVELKTLPRMNHSLESIGQQTVFGYSTPLAFLASVESIRVPQLCISRCRNRYMFSRKPPAVPSCLSSVPRRPLIHVTSWRVVQTSSVNGSRTPFPLLPGTPQPWFVSCCLRKKARCRKKQGIVPAYSE